MKRRLNYRLIFELLMVLACLVGLSANFIDTEEEKVAVVAEAEVTADNSGEAENVIESRNTNEARKKITEYAKKNGRKISEYPESIVALLNNNSETEKFVLEYPEKKNKVYNINLEKYKDSQTVPLLMQWDQRWGYTTYAGDCMGITGCGPTCLSMVAIYLTGDTEKNPKWMAEFATENNYANEESGSEWKLINEGGAKLGLNVAELTLDAIKITDNLQQGNPIICTMGPGDFTSSGHFIVMVGYENGEIIVNDPNSKSNSEKKWKFDEISSQIKNLWVFTR